MKTIEKFSPEVCKVIKSYVYRLVDPRNGQTFYVGKGKRNRVFDHVKNAKSSNDSSNSLKYERIKTILASNLPVIYIIQKYGLSDEEAKIVESTLIDAYCLDQLTNIKKGFGADDCPINAIELQANYSREEFEITKNTPKFILIKVKEYWLGERNNDLYATVRSAWKLNVNKAKEYPYVLGVVNGIVKGVYKAKQWNQAPGEKGRIEFTGTEAPNEIKELFMEKRIPEKFRRKGNANPALYSDKK